jgi:NADPH:quinone reductase-like Zn-dependent oxidoreductase
MSAQRAVIVQGKGKACLVSGHPISPLRPDTVLVKATYVALNPHDWRAIDHWDVDGCVVGCDFSGVVEEVSSGLMTRQFATGDRIMGTVHGSKYPMAALFGLKTNSSPVLRISPC